MKTIYINSVEEFREEEKELFDESGKMWPGIVIAPRQVELMRDAINDSENKIEELQTELIKLKRRLIR